MDPGSPVAAPFTLAHAVPSVVDLDQGRSFGAPEVDGLVERVARSLRGRGERRLGLVIAHTTLPTIVAHLALLRAGWVSMLVPAASRPEALAHWRARYAPDVVFDDPRVSPEDDGDGTFAGLRATVIDTGEGELPPGCVALLPTSGSTGSPRFVRLSAGALDANALAIVEALAIAPDDVALLPIPLAFAYGLSILHSHAVRGATVALTSRSVAEKALWPAAASAGVTSVPGVPYGYQLLRRTGFLRLELPRLRAMTQAGGRLDLATAREFLDALEPRGVRFYTMYGQTEATARIAVVPPEHARTKLGSAGRAVARSAITIEGERVVLRGPSVMLGYAEERGDLARGDDLGGVLDTGDLGAIDEDGFLWIRGRASRFSKLFGARVSLDDLESSLHRFGPAAVVERAEKLVAVLESTVEAQAVLEHLAVRFGIQPMSVRVRVGEMLPRLPSGKVAYGDIA